MFGWPVALDSGRYGHSVVGTIGAAGLGMPLRAIRHDHASACRLQSSPKYRLLLCTEGSTPTGDAAPDLTADFGNFA